MYFSLVFLGKQNLINTTWTSWLWPFKFSEINNRSFSSSLGVRSDHREIFMRFGSQKTSTAIILKGTGLHFTHIVTGLLPHLSGKIQRSCPQVPGLLLYCLLQVIWSGARYVCCFGTECSLSSRLDVIKEHRFRFVPMGSKVSLKVLTCPLSLPLYVQICFLPTVPANLQQTQVLHNIIFHILFQHSLFYVTHNGLSS